MSTCLVGLDISNVLPRCEGETNSSAAVESPVFVAIDPEKTTEFLGPVSKDLNTGLPGDEPFEWPLLPVAGPAGTASAAVQDAPLPLLAAPVQEPIVAASPEPVVARHVAKRSSAQMGEMMPPLPKSPETSMHSDHDRSSPQNTIPTAVAPSLAQTCDSNRGPEHQASSRGWMEGRAASQTGSLPDLSLNSQFGPPPFQSRFASMSVSGTQQAPPINMHGPNGNFSLHGFGAPWAPPVATSIPSLFMSPHRHFGGSATPTPNFSDALRHSNMSGTQSVAEDVKLDVNILEQLVRRSSTSRAPPPPPPTPIFDQSSSSTDHMRGFE
jgi:hypothetical protein